LHQDGETVRDLPGEDFPARRKLIDHIRPHLRNYLESVFGNHCPPFHVALKRLGLRTWDTPLDEYAGQQVDIYLLDIKDKADSLIRPQSDSSAMNNQPANRFGIFMPSTPLRDAVTVDWDKKLLFGFLESTAENTLITKELTPPVSSERREQNVESVAGTSDIYSLRSEGSAGYACITTVHPISRDQDHFGLLRNQTGASTISSEDEVNLELEAASQLPGFHSEACGYTRRDTALQILNPHRTAGRDGYYIIRPGHSSTGAHRFTLSITHRGAVHHVSILRNEDGTYNFFECSQKCDSLRALLDYYGKHPLKPDLFLKTPVP
jgi:hypothetical protein